MDYTKDKPCELNPSSQGHSPKPKETKPQAQQVEQAPTEAQQVPKPN